LNCVYPRASFYWAFIQTSNASLEKVECREKLISMLTRSELTLPVVKRILVALCHRVGASRPAKYAGIEGLLQLLGSAMALANQDLQPQCFYAVKEFMILRLNHMKVFCETPLPSGVRDGKSLCGSWHNVEA
jgi:hypothetical protein